MSVAAGLKGYAVLRSICIEHLCCTRHVIQPKIFIMTAKLSDLYTRYPACLNAQKWAELGDFVDPDVIHNGRPLGLAGYRRMLEENFRDIPDLYFVTELASINLPCWQFDLHLIARRSAASLAFRSMGIALPLLRTRSTLLRTKRFVRCGQLSIRRQSRLSCLREERRSDALVRLTHGHLTGALCCRTRHGENHQSRMGRAFQP